MIAPSASGLFGDFGEGAGPLARTAMDWEIYPEGIHHLLKRIHEDYADGLPIYITENGMASDDAVSSGRVADPGRIDYLFRHLDKVRQARSEGVNVAGYFVWSLLDNFEWSYGYDKRFGLVHVDFRTQQRTPKDSYRMLAEALRR